MAIQALIILLIVGGIAGWLAGLATKGSGFGLIGDIVLGIVGAFVARFLLPPFGSGIIAIIISAFIGACVVIFLVRLIKRAVT
jgi:uncharacterized membrane protein YeaQ/YmgE (transglycosylase-associated protein family)